VASQYFTNSNEAMSFISQNATAAVHKYSILNALERYRNSDRSFRFKLVYPSLAAPNTIEWSQTNNPTSTKEVTDSIAITNSPWEKGIGCGSWRGGLISGNTSTLITGDGSNVCWWYAIGAYASYNGGIPGPNSSAINWVQLWAYYPTSISSGTTSTIPTPISNMTTSRNVLLGGSRKNPVRESHSKSASTTKRLPKKSRARK